jgi:uncharacterized protein YkwD
MRLEPSGLALAAMVVPLSALALVTWLDGPLTLTSERPVASALVSVSVSRSTPAATGPSLVSPGAGLHPPPHDSKAVAVIEPLEQQVLALVNEARARGRRCGSHGVFAPAPALRLEPLLMAAARAHAADQADRGIMSHQGSGGTTPSQRVLAHGYHWMTVGENVATGQQTANEVVLAWLNSPGHCRNILEPEFKDMGIGMVIDTAGRSFWAQEFGKVR